MLRGRWSALLLVPMSGPRLDRRLVIQSGPLLEHALDPTWARAWALQTVRLLATLWGCRWAHLSGLVLAHHLARQLGRELGSRWVMLLGSS